MKEILTKKDKMLIWFIGEIIQFIVMTMFSIIITWLYTPYSIIGKTLITAGISIISYSMLKNFVYVRWILWKETEGQTHFDKELKKVE